MLNDTIKYDQTIYDFCVWKYGSITKISKLKRDNSIGLPYPQKGDTVEYEKDEGNNNVKDFYTSRDIVVTSMIDSINKPDNFIVWDNNASPVSYGNEFNNYLLHS